MAAIFLISLLAWAVQRVPEWQVKRATSKYGTLRPGDAASQMATIESEMRKTVIQILGGIFAIGALYLTYRRTLVTEQGHITDRYTKAIEQLGATKTSDDGKSVPNVEVRLGAIYALERIAFDSPRDHWTIMEVLTAYVRENSPSSKSSEPDEDEKSIARTPSTEIQAILTVLGRRRRHTKREGKGRWLNLSGTDLRGAILRNAHLEDAQFQGARLERANFSGAYVERTDFSRSYAKGVNFTGANVNGANFDQAVLDGASFTKTLADGALFTRTKMRGAIFADAHLQKAFFSRTHAENARFIRANLTSASFKKTHIEGAYFRDSDGLAVEQMQYSLGWEQAIFDPEFKSLLAEAATLAKTNTDLENVIAKPAE